MYRKGQKIRMTRDCDCGGFQKGDEFTLTDNNSRRALFIDNDGDYRGRDNGFELIPAFTLETGTFYRTSSGKPTGRVTVGDTGFEAIVEGRVRIYDAAGGHVHGDAELDIVEVWAPKVGERVRCTQGCGDATVKYLAEGGKFLVDWDDGTVGEIPWLAGKDFEPLPVAAPQPPLTIEAGKFYRTRDGRKVGPIKSAFHWLYADFNGTSQPFFEDGTHGAGLQPNKPCLDLIAEWPETSNVGAQVDTLAEEYGPAPASNDNAAAEPDTTLNIKFTSDFSDLDAAILVRKKKLKKLIKLARKAGIDLREAA